MPGKLIVVSGPSGSGKTTIARWLLERVPLLRFSVSATTRPKRVGEEEGRDYYFLTRKEFLDRVAAGAFVEWEEVFGNCYGTPAAEIERARREGAHLLFDVDVKGALSIKRRYPEALLIFIQPPSMETLRERLQGRHTESDEELGVRLERAAMELERGKEFDRRVVNDALERAAAEVHQIVLHYLSPSI